MKHEQTGKQDRMNTGRDQGIAGDDGELKDCELDAIVGGIAVVPNRVSAPVTRVNGLDGVI